MQTEILMKGFLLVLLAWCSCVQAEYSQVGVLDPCTRASSIFVVEVTSAGHYGENVKGRILQVVKSEVKADGGIEFVYPRELIGTTIPAPAKGMCLVVFLVKENVLKVYDEMNSVWPIAKEDSEAAAKYIRGFCNWSTSGPPEQTKLISSALGMSGAIQDKTMDALMVDFHKDVSAGRLINEDGLCHLVKALKSESAQTRFKALSILGLTGRRDLVSYLIAGLDDSNLQDVAMMYLEVDARRGGSQPELSADMPKAQKIHELKRWWETKASSDPRYRTASLGKAKKE